MQETKAVLVALDPDNMDDADLVLLSGHMTGERPTQILVSAAGQPLPETWGLTSVFDLAFLPVPKAQQGRQAGPVAAVLPIQAQVHTIITREPGITRCQRQHYSETPAWRDQERARRARQRPPRPSRRAKTMGKQLTELLTASLQPVHALP